MKQLGNLAIVCAQRPEILLQVYRHRVSVHLGEGPGREALQAPWDDDAAINQMIYELNFGRYAAEKGEKAA